MNFEDIVSHLPKLSQKQLIELQTRIKLLLSTGPPGESTDVDIVLECISDVAQSLGLGRTPPAALKKTTQFASLRDKTPVLMQFLKEAGIENRIEVRSILKLAIGYLYKNLTEMNAAVGTRTLMSHIHRVPDILNQQFPGYASSGLLRIVVVKETDK